MSWVSAWFIPRHAFLQWNAILYANIFPFTTITQENKQINVPFVTNMQFPLFFSFGLHKTVIFPKDCLGSKNKSTYQHTGWPTCFLSWKKYIKPITFLLHSLFFWLFEVTPVTYNQQFVTSISDAQHTQIQKKLCIPFLCAVDSGTQMHLQPQKQKKAVMAKHAPSLTLLSRIYIRPFCSNPIGQSKSHSNTE